MNLDDAVTRIKAATLDSDGHPFPDYANTTVLVCDLLAILREFYHEPVPCAAPPATTSSTSTTAAPLSRTPPAAG